MSDPKKLKHHLFICTNERPQGHPRGCCAQKGGAELVEKFKAELVARGLQGQIRAQRAGCLDACEQGASLVVYPEGIWYGRVTASDIPVIVQEHLIEGRPVKKLQIR